MNENKMEIKIRNEMENKQYNLKLVFFPLENTRAFGDYMLLF